MSKVNFKVKQRPAPPEDVHQLALMLAHIVEEVHHMEPELEACGMSLYHLMPPDLVREESFCLMTADPEGGLGADVD